MKRDCSGFTLIELLVVASIMAILFSLSTAYYNQFNRSQILGQAVLDLKNNFRLAQSMALTGEKPSSGCGSLDGYQITFSANLYRIRAKCGDSLVGTERVFNLPSVLEVQPVPSPILFKVLAQGVVGAQSISLCGFGRLYRITVSASGEIRDEGFVGSCGPLPTSTPTLPPTPTPTPPPIPTSTPSPSPPPPTGRWMYPGCTVLPSATYTSIQQYFSDSSCINSIGYMGFSGSCSTDGSGFCWGVPIGESPTFPTFQSRKFNSGGGWGSCQSNPPATYTSFTSMTVLQWCP